MKKSQVITLVLITAALASCHKKQKKQWGEKNVYMRADSSAAYGRSHTYNNGLLWYYAFRPYGYYNNGHYTRAGFYSGGISEGANVGSSGFKSGVVRGGFGGHGFSVGS